jgi:hypothetical protein
MSDCDHEIIRAKDERIKALERALISLIGWSFGGACSDCDMFREAPCRIEFQHHAECAHLEDLNKAAVLLGREPDVGHTYEDAPGEMLRLADERSRICNEERHQRELHRARRTDPVWR